MAESQVIVDVINKSLKDKYSIDIVTGKPIFRVVWSESEFETRWMDTTDSGIQLLHRELRVVPKYRQWIQNKHLLERLVMVPEVNADDLPGQKISYESLFVFEKGNGEYLPPTLQICCFIIDNILAAQAHVKYMVDGTDSPDRGLMSRYKETNEEYFKKQSDRLKSIEEELYGDESGLLGMTFNESGPTIIVPHKQFGDK